MPADTNAFFARPILNSPYHCPGRHRELDEDGRPTSNIVATRRSAKFVTPIPKPKKIRGKPGQQADLGITADGSGAGAQDYDLTSIINEVRGAVDRWRMLPQEEWRVTPETARLLNHWRSYPFGGIRPFFCQIEAAETAIWLTEVAPHTADGKRLLTNLRRVNQEANPGVNRLALKLATGAGKTMVMAMLIAWQTVNAVRHPASSHFTRGFLIVTPGLTIRDRLRVLQPNDPDSYYTTRELLPPDLLPVIHSARIVITNYHAFKLRERLPLAKGTRALIAERCYSGRFPRAMALLNYPESGLLGLAPAHDPTARHLLYTGNVTEDRGALTWPALWRICPSFRLRWWVGVIPALQRACAGLPAMERRHRAHARHAALPRQRAHQVF